MMENFVRLLLVDKSMGAGAKISLPRMGFALAFPCLVILISIRLKLNFEYKLCISVLRTIVQLLLAGYVLLSFIFSLNSPVYVGLYLLFMSLIAAVETNARLIRTYSGHYIDALLSIILGGGLIGSVGALVIFDPNPWYQPQVIIPTTGMIIGSTVSAPSIALDRLLNEVADKTYESETRLAFGANKHEAILPIFRSAFQAAMLPNLNMMSIVGLVSIPGMMTGQLLGGASPATAAQFQMAILWLMCASSAISTYIAMELSLLHAVFDNEHRLTTNKIIKKKGKEEIDTALYNSFLYILRLIYQQFNRFCCCLAFLTYKSRDTKHHYKRLPVNSINKAKSSNGEIRSVELTVIKEDDIESKTETLSFTIEDNDDYDNEFNNNENSKIDDNNIEISPSPSMSPVYLNSPTSPSRYKVSYEIITNNPTDHLDIIHHNTSNNNNNNTDQLLAVNNLNVLSGEINLFDEKGLNINIKCGEIITLEGPSGIGKTRLLRALSLLDKPLAGAINLSSIGSYTTQSPFKKTPLWRRRVMYVPQSIPPMIGCPKDLISECCGYSCRSQSSEAINLLKELDVKCEQMEDMLLLERGKMNALWNSLSGGERQRCIIGCSLLLGGLITSNSLNNNSNNSNNSNDNNNKNHPHAILLLDEPTAACDEVTCAAVERALLMSGLSAILITHDVRQSLRIANRRIVLYSSDNNYRNGNFSPSKNNSYANLPTLAQT
eukprot:gene10274-13815_t